MSGFLSHIESPPGVNKRKKRLGRGDASGHGGTSTRGHKGQRSRSGGYHKLGFEGGQMPLTRRIPKRGFHNPSRKEFSVVNVSDLIRFPAGTLVDPQALIQQGLVGHLRDPIKILGDGDLSVGLTVRAHHFSKSAIEKIEKAGGKAELIQG
jgi:large subunit ribosomal protein L15